MSDLQTTGTKTKAGNPKIELSISCRNNGKSRMKSQDLVCITYKKKHDETKWVKLGRTESLNSKNEFFQYAKKFVLDYDFGERLFLKFVLCKFDDANDVYGSISCTLAQIVNKKQLQLKLSGSHDASITIAAEELSDVGDKVTLTFGGYKLDRKDLFGFGRSDPYLVISKSLDSGSFVVVHRTEVIENNLSPSWKPFTIPVSNLCNGDYNRKIKLECFDFDSNEKSEFIGKCLTTLKEMSEVSPGTHRVFECINPELKQNTRGYKNSGEIHLKGFSKQRVYSFTDYIRGGLQLECVIAIDFTSSNKNQNTSENLHLIGPDYQNPYQQVMRALAENMQDYDSDKMFHVLGFGAKLPDGRVSHNFNVSMDDANPQVSGVEGVFDAYRTCLEKIELYGPTHFAEVINHVSGLAKKHEAENPYYCVLLILTDGTIDDEKETIKAIVSASSLPISIVIVGIGNADFKTMVKLDADKIALNSVDGARAKRDIVQFINYQTLLNADKSTAKALLAKKMLEEIPTQLLSYMNMYDISPGSPAIS
ncbi:hypothetical protein B566_EDAN005385 [Ephemera danica]|nr:hypothetical protein B566_EDAN005385 [Ephemera danica]